MNSISLSEFNTLPEKKKENTYKNLNEHDKFLARISAPISGEVIGHRQLNKKEQQEAKEFEEKVKSGNINKWFNKE